MRKNYGKKNEKGKVQLKGQLKLYIQWPAIMSLLLIAMDLWVYKLDHRAGILMAVFVLIYIIMVGGLYFYSKNIIMKDLIKLMDPKYIEVWGKFTPRGGISIDPYCNYGKPGTKWEEVAWNRLSNHDLYPEKIDNR